MFDPTLNAVLQRLSNPWLSGFFQFVTVFGSELVIGAILSVLLWTWDKRKAFLLIQFIVYSDLINHLLKEIFQMPRPFQVAPDQVAALDVFIRRALSGDGVTWALPARTSYGFPSGHAQVAICFWGALALHARRRGATVGAVVLIALIVLSRLFLGVHFLGDVIGGLAVGAILLTLYAVVVWRERRGDRLARDGFEVALAFLAPVALFLLWPDPVSARRVGLLVGFAAGYLAETHWVGFSTGGQPADRVARAFVGLALLSGVRLLLSFLSDRFGADTSWSDPILLAAGRYALTGLAAAGLIPIVFVLTGLGERTGRMSNSGSARRQGGGSADP